MPAPTLSDDQVRFLRLRAHHLTARRPGPAGAVAQLTAALGAVQAQELAAAGLALRARCRSLVASEVEKARVEDRSVVRTWCLRGTLHLVATPDVGWLLALAGPGQIQAGQKRRAELGLDEDTAARGVGVLVDLLRERGPQTRAEFRDALIARGLPAAGQATYHLLQLAGLEGRVCFGPDREGEPTFVDLAGWIDLASPLSLDVAAVELARRYLAGYGPATVADFVAWSGLAAGRARTAWQHLAGEMLEVEHQGRPAWLPASRALWLDEQRGEQPIVRLIPGYDPYLLGYRRRDLAVLPEHARSIHPGGGLLRPTLLVNGLAAGTWAVDRSRRLPPVAVKPFRDMEGLQRELQAEIEDVAHFVQN